jgi:hypothetical protein
MAVAVVSMKREGGYERKKEIERERDRKRERG